MGAFPSPVESYECGAGGGQAARCHMPKEYQGGASYQHRQEDNQVRPVTPLVTRWYGRHRSSPRWIAVQAPPLVISCRSEGGGVWLARRARLPTAQKPVLAL